MDLAVPKEAEIALKVIRCGCGDPDGHPGNPCPSPRTETDLGVVSYTSSNPVRRLLWDRFGKLAADRRINAANKESN